MIFKNSRTKPFLERKVANGVITVNMSNQVILTLNLGQDQKSNKKEPKDIFSLVKTLWG